jgi:hypothetical protein
VTVLAAEAADEGTAYKTAKAAGKAYGAQAAYVGSNARLAPGSRNYQSVILAEFLTAIVILTVVPIVSGGSPAAQAKGSPSPYDTGDLRQLAAVGMVYFILALVSSGNSGRLAAWLGGLVLITLALGKVAGGELSATVKNLDPTQKQTGEETGTGADAG